MPSTVCTPTLGECIGAIEMDKSQKSPLKPRFRRGLSALVLLGAVVGIGGWASWQTGEKPLPEQSPEAVVEKFYEYISESKIRGGTLLIREAFKLTSGGQSRYDQAKFLEVINRYPSGFNATITKANIQERRAEVAIEYKMASSFGGAYMVNSVIALIVDEKTNTWKIDFRGDTDDQDISKIRNEYSGKASKLTAAKSAAK